ncbi:MAG: hypothetical protein D6785_02735 [Planctomycetota bacterium]|nr:MAG: hypothetical protein D6785_02735 [Planctomycetota bacterium]
MGRKFSQKISLKWNLSTYHISPKAWNLLAKKTSPLFHWEWLAAFEQSGILNSNFKPAHLVLYRENQPIAIVPLYQKKDFLSEWAFGGMALKLMGKANLADDRLVGLIPYTPVPEYQFLLHPHEKKAPLVQIIHRNLEEFAKENNKTIHFQHLLSPSPLTEYFPFQNWVPENSFTYRWWNRNYRTFEDFLDFLPPKRRNKIRREIKACQHIEFISYRGREITPSLMKWMHQCYQANHWKHYRNLGDISLDFWFWLGERKPSFLHILVAKEKGEIVGMNLMVESSQGIYGRWWGCLKEIPFLHFNACYYWPIQYCIQKKLKFMDPGFQGYFKKWRGFEKMDIQSYIYVKDAHLRETLFFFIGFLASLSEDAPHKDE